MSLGQFSAGVVGAERDFDKLFFIMRYTHRLMIVILYLYDMAILL